MPTRILVVDDHPGMREVLRTVIEAMADLEVVGEAEDGCVGVRLALDLSPDIVLMDVSMPVMNGIDATRAIVTRMPGVKVIAVSVSCDRSSVERMRAAGASAYILKDDDLYDRLAEVIRAVAAGATYLCPAASRVMGEGQSGERASQEGA